MTLSALAEGRRSCWSDASAVRQPPIGGSRPQQFSIL